MCEIDSRVLISHQNVKCRIRIGIKTMPIHNKEFIPPRLLFTLKKTGLHVVTIHNDRLSIEFFSHGFIVFFYYCTRRQNFMYSTGTFDKSVLNLGCLVPQVVLHFLIKMLRTNSNLLKTSPVLLVAYSTVRLV